MVLTYNQGGLPCKELIMWVESLWPFKWSPSRVLFCCFWNGSCDKGNFQAFFFGGGGFQSMKKLMRLFFPPENENWLFCNIFSSWETCSSPVAPWVSHHELSDHIIPKLLLRAVSLVTWLLHRWWSVTWQKWCDVCEKDRTPGPCHSSYTNKL